VAQFRRPDKVTVFAALIVAAILLNVVQFRAIDRLSPPNFQAVRRDTTGDMITITYRECDWCQSRYGLHMALGFVAPGATVIVPTPSPYDRTRELREELTDRLVVFGKVADIRWVSFPDAGAVLVSTASPTGFDPSPYIIGHGPGGAKGLPWVLAVDPAVGPLGPAVTGADPDSLVDNALDVAARGESRGTARHRTFVLLQWNTQRPGADTKVQDVVVESSLLPVSVRTELGL
jgi:hypothetical protein